MLNLFLLKFEWEIPLDGLDANVKVRILNTTCHMYYSLTTNILMLTKAFEEQAAIA